MFMNSATSFYPVVPSDTVDLVNGTTSFLIVSVGGTLKVHDANGQPRALTVPAGRIDLRVTRVWSTGTAATGITACYG